MLGYSNLLVIIIYPLFFELKEQVNGLLWSFVTFTPHTYTHSLSHMLLVTLTFQKTFNKFLQKFIIPLKLWL